MSAKVIFYLKADKANKETGEMPVYARITVNGKRSNISINRVVHPDRWKETDKLETAQKKDDKEMRYYMDSIKSRIREIERELLEKKIDATADAIKDAYTGKGKHRSKTILEIIDWHNANFETRVECGDKADSTLKRFKQVRNHIENFIRDQYKIKAGDMPIDEIKYSFITDFDLYLRTNRKCNKSKTLRKCANNSAVKYVRNFRTIIKQAVDQEWFEFDPFQKYKGTVKEKKRQCLTPEEISIVENKEFTIQRLSVIKDIFLFSVYTGYAYCDVARLTPADVRPNIDGEKWIFTERLKTKVSENVMLLPKPLEIIQKYKDHPLCLMRGTLLPVPSNQRVNGYLKEIADLCGIDKKLTFHIARHTFATSIWLYNNGSLETLKDAMGHTNIKQTELYGQMLNKPVSDQMKKLRDKFTTKEGQASIMKVVG